MEIEMNKLTRYEKLTYYLKNNTSFKTDPASAKHHGNHEGGLRTHSYYVLVNLLYLTKKLDLKWQDPESPYIVAYAHDMCKIGAYIPKDGGGYSVSEAHPKWHGQLSVMMAEEVIELTDEERNCIRWHMGAYDERKNWQKFNDALKKYPNVLWTHNADMMATHFDEAI